MRRPQYLPALVFALALAGPVHADAPKELCSALVLMAAVLTLPSEHATGRVHDDTPLRTDRMEQRLIRRAHHALDKAAAHRALPDATIAQYRAILSDRANGRRPAPDEAQPEALGQVTRQVQKAWQQVCKKAEGHVFASEETDTGAIGTRSASGTLPVRPVHGVPEKSRSPLDQPSMTSGLAGADQWQMLAVIAAAAGVFALAGTAYVEMQGRRKRRAQRFGCDVAGCLSTAAGMTPVRVRDISRLGCLLRINLGPAAKTRCRVWIHDHWIEGRVAWSNKCYIGLEFRQLQSREFIIGIARGRHRGIPANAMAASRLPRQDT